MHALNLIEATNLLIMDGRRLVPEGGKILERRIRRCAVERSRPATTRIAASDICDICASTTRCRRANVAGHRRAENQAMIEAGTALDDVCESCHMTFWYPNQPIYRITTHLGAHDAAGRDPQK